MYPEVDVIVKTFLNACKVPTPTSGTILNKEGQNLLISTCWTQHNAEQKKEMSSEMFHLVDLTSKKVTQVGCVENSGHLLVSYSPSRNYKAIVREQPATKKKPKKQFIEIWKSNQMLQQFDLQSYDIHGDIYTDSEFQCFEWSPCEKKILYVAEKKLPKTESFLSVISKSSSEEKEVVTKGDEYLFAEDWGETLVGKCNPVLAVADLTSGLCSLVDMKSGSDEEVSVGCGVWAPGGGIVALAFPTWPRRLGKVYCSNRRSYLFHIDPTTSAVTKLTGDDRAVSKCWFSPDFTKLVFLEQEVLGPHINVAALKKLTWSNKKVETVLEEVLTESKCQGGQPFYGLYNFQPGRCWLADNKTIVLSTPQKTSVKTYAIDTDLCRIQEIGGCKDESFSQGILKVQDNLVLCWKSSLNTTPGIVIQELKSGQIEDSIEWTPIVKSETVNENYDCEVFYLNRSDDSQYKGTYSNIFYAPKSEQKVPLVVWSHGGPHSLFPNSYNFVANFFSHLGLAMLMVNYRGSLGQGKTSIEHLLGKVGTSDVLDVQHAVDFILQSKRNIDSNKCLLFGGSHGGFLTLHLAGQFPNKYKSAVARNPVTDIAAMPDVSDIPDWSYTEAGLKYPSKLSGADLEKMLNISPIVHAERVTADVLLLLGKKDLRVPYYQGISYYHQLKAHRKAYTKLHEYEDNHSLSNITTLTDSIINTAVWFFKSLKKLK